MPGNFDITQILGPSLTAIGTGVGAAFGVPQLGMQAGQLVGGLTTQIVNSTQQARHPAEYADNTQLDNINYQAGLNQTLNPTGNAMTYAFGGNMQAQPLQPQMTEYKGPRHEQGGISVDNNNEVEGGEVKVGSFIFSDRLTVPDENKTFAEMAKNIQKKYKSHKTDDIERNSMIRELSQLASLQEQVKKEIVQQYQQQYGQQEQQTNSPEQVQNMQQLAQQQGTQPVGSQNGPRDGSGPNGQMLRQMMQESQQPQQFAYGGPKKTKNGNSFTLGTVFKPLQRNSYKALIMNRYAGTVNTQPATWYQRQFYAQPTLFSGYSGNPYTPVTVKASFPLYKRKKFNTDTGKYEKQGEGINVGVYPAYFYTPQQLGNFAGSQYIPNLWGIGLTNKNVSRITKRTRELAEELLPINNKKENAYGGIHIKPENRGKFTEYCGGKVTNECIQKGLRSNSPVIRKRANFARNARKWKHGFGGFEGDPPKGWKVSKGYSMPDVFSNPQAASGYETQTKELLNQQPDILQGYSNWLPQNISKYSDLQTRYNGNINQNVISNDINRKGNLTDQYWGGTHQSLYDYLTSSGWTYGDNGWQKYSSLNSNEIQPVKTTPLKQKTFKVSNVDFQPELQQIPIQYGRDKSKLDILKDSLSNIDLNGLGDKLGIDLDKFKDKLGNINWGDIAKTVGTSLGGLYDIIRGSLGGQYESYGRLTPLQLRKLDPTEAISQANQQATYTQNRLGTIGGLSKSRLMNVMIANQQATGKNVASIRNQYDLQNQGIMNKQDTLNNQIQQKNIQLDMTQNDINARERDEARNTVQRGLTTLSQGINQTLADAAKRKAQDNTIQMISQENYGFMKDDNGNWIMVSKEVGQDGNIYNIYNGKVYDQEGNEIGTLKELKKKKFFKSQNKDDSKS